MKRLSFLVLALGLSIMSLKSQPPYYGKMREEFKAQRVAMITRELNLTPSEAEKFWPIYNEYLSKRDAILQDRCMNIYRIGVDSLSDKEAEKLADDNIIKEQKLVDLKKEYNQKFKSVLPGKKLLKLYMIERDFKREMMKDIRGNRMGKRGGGYNGLGNPNCPYRK